MGFMKKSKAVTQSDVKPYTSEQNRTGLERLIFFSDAVFAIAITILVLDIRLPAGIDLTSDSQLRSALLDLWPKYLAYFLSFWVIGLYWMNHHRKFLFIKKFDPLLLSLNLLFLMVIAFIPFPTAVVSEYTNRTVSIFYALIMALAGLLLAILWLHVASNPQLTDTHLSKQQRWREAAGLLVIVAIFLLSIGVSFIAGGWVRIVWLLIIPVAIVMNVRRVSA